MSPQFKSIFYDVLEQTDGIIHLLDLIDDSTYTDIDFNDMDHLNDNGAAKMTEAILALLSEL